MESEDTERILNEILKWERLQGMHILREILPRVLDTKQKRSVYEMTNGENTSRGISKRVEASNATISNWWNQWLSQGIVTKEGKKFKKLISLKDFNIELLKKEGENE